MIWIVNESKTYRISYNFGATSFVRVMLCSGHGVHTMTIFIFSIDEELYVMKIIGKFYPTFKTKIIFFLIRFQSIKWVFQAALNAFLAVGFLTLSNCIVPDFVPDFDLK